MIKVLIAEDEPLSLQNLTGHLRRLLGADALIEGAANGREAVDMARRIRPQLVLMDIEMPVMTGLDAAAIIHEALPETHIVFLTAFDRFDYAVGAMRAGGADYLLKPFDSAQINACLQKLGLLTEKQEHREERSENPFCAQFSVWLANHYMQDISLEEAAEAMGMSSFYFSRFFRTAYNRTFLEYLTSYRIERAEELLRQVDRTRRVSATRTRITSPRCSSVTAAARRPITGAGCDCLGRGKQPKNIVQNTQKDGRKFFACRLFPCHTANIYDTTRFVL